MSGWVVHPEEGGAEPALPRSTEATLAECSVGQQAYLPTIVQPIEAYPRLAYK